MEQGQRKESLIFLEFENNKIPEFKEVRGKDWIFYGEKNDYPDYLIELYTRCAKHHSIITGKVNYTIGGGWAVKTEGADTSGIAITADHIKKANEYQSYDDLTKLAELDFYIFGGFAFEVIWSKNKKSIAEIYHIPFNKLRTNADESKYFYSNNWKDNNQDAEKTGFKELKPFDPNKPGGKQVFVFCLKSPRKTGEINVYPLPDYMGGVAAIETDIEISNYHLSAIRTGFSAGTMITLMNGAPTDDEAKKIERKFKEKFTGTDRAGSLILNFADGKEKAAEVVHIQPSDVDKQYIELAKRVEQEIFVCHKVTSPMLFGIKTEGQLGGRTELMEAYEHFQNTYISHVQDIFAQIFNGFLKINKIPGEIYLKKTEPIGMTYSEELIKSVLPMEALREMVAEKMGIDLSKYNKGVTTTTVTSVVMAENTPLEDRFLIETFSKYGKPKGKYAIIKSRPIKFCSHEPMTREELLANEEELRREIFAQEIDIKSIDRSVIDLLSKDPLMPPKEIAKAIGATEKQVKDSIDKLVKSGALKRTSDTSGGEKVSVIEPSTSGTDIIDETPAKTIDIQIMYSYEWRAPFSQSNIKTSRDFCKELLSLDRLYLRSEIEQISEEVGYSVWMHRGGFYRKPGTNVTLPYCRHIWQQNVVKEIK